MSVAKPLSLVYSISVFNSRAVILMFFEQTFGNLSIYAYICHVNLKQNAMKKLISFLLLFWAGISAAFAYEVLTLNNTVLQTQKIRK